MHDDPLSSTQNPSISSFHVATTGATGYRSLGLDLWWEWRVQGVPSMAELELVSDFNLAHELATTGSDFTPNQ